MKSTGMKFSLCLVALWVWLAPLPAQLPTATILGTVKDGTGAVIPGASVTARNTDNGQTRSTVTGANGSYHLPALPVGNYEVRVEQQGFQTAVRSGLTLAVSQEALINFDLQVGAVEQTISVTAEAPLVNTTAGSLGGLVDEQKIADLPLNGRNYIDLTMMQTGVQQHKNINFVAGMSGTWFSSNGAPLRSNNYLLDGAQMANLYGATSASVNGATLGVEGIREYRVVTNSFSAEYGMSMGSQMTIVSKSGANQLHGSVFEYLRNNVLDARNFFDRKTAAEIASNTGRRLPPFVRNNFGGSVGGPIKQDKTHFHLVYEALRERFGDTKVSNTIPEGCRGAAGSTISNATCSLMTATQAPVQVATVIPALMALFPLPNLPGNQFTFPFSQPTNEQYGQVRIDHVFSESDTLFGRYTVDDSEQVKALNFPQFQSQGLSRSQFSTLSETHVFSPTVLNTFRYSYSRTKIDFQSPSGLIGPQYSFVPGKELGSITIGGVTGLGPDGVTPFVGKQNIFTWSDDVFYTRGSHSLKFGTLINRYQQYMVVSTNNRGTATFADLRGFLAGATANVTAITPGSVLDRTYFYNSIGFYAQDDWRMLPTLTLNLGLRYEFITQPNEVRGAGAALRDILHDTETTLGIPFVNPSKKNFSPRFGFAWDVRGDGTMAVRGGFGLLYDVGNLGSALIVGTTATPPFSRQSSLAGQPLTLPFTFTPANAGRALRTVDYNIPQPKMMQYNLTIERQLPGDMAISIAYGGSRGINILRTVEGNPTIPQGIPDGINCVRSATFINLVTDGPKCWVGGDPRNNPAWANVEYKTGGGNSFYNSFQFGLTKRLSKGLQFQSSYTWSKTIDETQSQLGAENNSSQSIGSDPSNRKTDRGRASFDLDHNWRFNAIYRLPEFASGSVTGKLLNGWWMSGILSVQAGYPFNPIMQTNRSRSAVASAQGDRPNRKAGRTYDDVILGGPDRYFDPTAFEVGPAGFLGTAGRNILRGPGFATLDYSLVKDTAIGMLGEAGKLEFRAEFFNILNRANFVTPGIGAAGNSAGVLFAGNAGIGDPNPNAPLASAGRILQTAGTSRQIQFALKLLF